MARDEAEKKAASDMSRLHEMLDMMQAQNQMLKNRMEQTQLEAQEAIEKERSERAERINMRSGRREPGATSGGGDVRGAASARGARVTFGRGLWLEQNSRRRTGVVARVWRRVFRWQRASGKHGCVGV